MLDFNLDDILEQPTQVRSNIHNEPSEEITDFSNLQFDESDDFEEVEKFTRKEPKEAIEIDIPYDAEENAEILVELIDVANIQTLTPLAKWKLRKKLGGKPGLRQKQILFEKKFNKEELTDGEKRDIELYQAYLKDKLEIEEAIPYTPDEKEALKTAAIPYLKQSKLRIGGGASFWTQLAMIQGGRIMQVLTA